MSTGWNIYRIHYEKLTGLDGQMKGPMGRQKPVHRLYFCGETAAGGWLNCCPPFAGQSILSSHALLCPADLDHIACHAYLGDDLVQFQIACDGEFDGDFICAVTVVFVHIEGSD